MFVTNRKDHAILAKICREHDLKYDIDEDDEFNIDIPIKPENLLGGITAWIER